MNVHIPGTIPICASYFYLTSVVTYSMWSLLVSSKVIYHVCAKGLYKGMKATQIKSEMTYVQMKR